MLPKNVVRASGKIRARASATLAAPITAKIVKMHVRVGERVKKGQALVRLDGSNIAISIRQAQAAVRMAEVGREMARTELARAKELHNSGSLSPADYDRAVAADQQSEAGLDQARQALLSVKEVASDHTMRAPFAGVITARMKDVGDTASMMPPTPILEISDLNNLEVRVTVPEPFAANVKAGDRIDGKASPDDQAFRATVSVVGSVVDDATRTVEVLADVIEPSSTLRPGAIATIDLTSQLQGTGPFVPMMVVVNDGGESHVWVVKDSTARKQPVRLQPISPSIARVLEGLSVDDEVVSEGLRSLREGTHVNVIADEASGAVR